MSHHASGEIEKRLKILAVFNLIIGPAQFLIGLMIGSSALRSDGLHNTTDGGAFVFSWIAERFSRKSPNKQKTYGYHRVGTLAAGLNASTLMALAAVVIYSSVTKISDPPVVPGRVVFFGGLAGLLYNLINFFAARPFAKNNLNIKSAVTHAFYDALSSLFAMFAGILIVVKSWYVADPIFGTAIGALMIAGGLKIWREVANELSEGTPPGIDIDEMTEHLLREHGVIGVHDPHSWPVGSLKLVSVHVVIDDQFVSQTDPLKSQIRQCLKEHYGIDHVVLETDTADCQIDL